jgi:hypothetical protein
MIYSKSTTYTVRGGLNIMKCQWEIPNSSLKYTAKHMIDNDGGAVTSLEWEIFFDDSFQFLKCGKDSILVLDGLNSDALPSTSGILKFALFVGEHRLMNSV